VSETAFPVSTGTASPGKAWRVTLWVLQVLAAVMFLFAGYLKLSSSPDMVALFAGIGAGQWFRYVTGALEILGALALFIPRLRAPGAIGLGLLLVGALITDLFIVHISPLPALVDLVVVAVIAWGRRQELATLLPTG
jgi:putative oxidoreductase